MISVTLIYDLQLQNPITSLLLDVDLFERKPSYLKKSLVNCNCSLSLEPCQMYVIPLC